MSKGTPSRGGKGTKGGGKRDNQTQQACPRCANTDHTSAHCPHSDKTCRKKLVFWRVRHDLLEHRSPMQREAVRRAREARVEVLELWRERAPVVPVSQEGPWGGRFDHSEPGEQPGHHHGWRNWKLLRLCQRERPIPEPSGAGEEICSVEVPSVREGEFVDSRGRFRC